MMEVGRKSSIVLVPKLFRDGRPSFFRVFENAEVAELADAHGSGPCSLTGLGVQLPPSAPIFK